MPVKRAKIATFNLRMIPMLDMTTTTQNAMPARVRQVTPRASFQWVFDLGRELVLLETDEDDVGEDEDEGEGEDGLLASDPGCVDEVFSWGHGTTNATSPNMPNSHTLGESARGEKEMEPLRANKAQRGTGAVDGSEE